MASSRYWRIRGYQAGTGGNGSIAATEVQLRSTAGGANIATGGVASASSVFSTFAAANAFDGNSGTVFSSNSGGSEQWLQYVFATAVELQEVVWALNGGLNGAHISMDVWSSQDAGVTWDLEWRMTRMADWVASETRTFTRPGYPNFTPRLYWRFISFSNSQGGQPINAFAEVEFRSSVGGTQPSGGVAFADSFFAVGLEADKAFNGILTDLWASTNTSPPHWIGCQFSSAFYCPEFRLVARSDSVEWRQAPQFGILQSCDDNKTWVDNHTIQDAIIWTGPNQSVLIQQNIYTAADIAIANAAIETMDGFGSREKAGIANVAIETLDGFGSRERAGFANVVLESVVGPPITQLWIANTVIESIIMVSPGIFPRAQIIGG